MCLGVPYTGDLKAAEKADEPNSSPTNSKAPRQSTSNIGSAGLWPFIANTDSSVVEETVLGANSATIDATSTDVGRHVIMTAREASESVRAQRVSLSPTSDSTPSPETRRRL